MSEQDQRRWTGIPSGVDGGDALYPQRGSLRDRSARHYLLSGPQVARLETTLALVARALGFPVVRVNILDEASQHNICLYGVGNLDSVAREEAFCDHVVRDELPVIVEDTTVDARFANYPAVVSGEIGAYLGVPLRGRESLVVGAVCVIDQNRRTLGADEVERLLEFARIVEDQLDLIRRLREQRQLGAPATAELARAIQSGEILPWYQPVIELATGRLIGFEALARWVHPDGAVDDPRLFIPLAEDSDLILELDLAVIKAAFDDLSRWRAEGGDRTVSVNLSARHFGSDDFIGRLRTIAEEAGVPPTSVILELTETTRLAESTADVVRMVQVLRGIGFRVWLDDFGTGWSALDHLLWLPVDGIKIDRALAVALNTPIGDALTKAVTGLARSLDLKTTIEGIETDQIAQLAKAIGCDNGQGFLWAEPQPVSVVDGWMTASGKGDDSTWPIVGVRPQAGPTRVNGRY